MGKRLLVLAGPDEGRNFGLGVENFLVGRSRATDTQLIDPHVARVHCQVQWDGENHVLSDFESEGGTFVNGIRIRSHALKAGDLVRIGNTRLQFLEDDQAAAPEAATTLAPPRTVTMLADSSPISAAPTAPAPVPVSGWARQLIGQTFGNYKVGALLAKSKTGYVFHARHTRKNLPVALKILDPRYSSDDKLVKRFVEAMKTVLPLRHPNLVQIESAGKSSIESAGKSSSHCWVAMEYVRSESLAAVIGRIETTGMFDWRNVLRVMIYLTRGLIYAHAKKIIHKCVTPPNILLGKDLSQTKLSDLMLASAIERDPTLPQENGEPSDELAYMSPERTDGPGKEVDSRTDIYSLGASAYALLTGQPPFQGATPQELIKKIRLQSPPDMGQLHPGVPEELETTILTTLAKRPEDRQQSAKDLLTDLEAVAQAHDVKY